MSKVIEEIIGLTGFAYNLSFAYKVKELAYNVGTIGIVYDKNATDRLSPWAERSHILYKLGGTQSEFS